MTWTDLASLPVDLPHSTVRNLSLNQHSSRPGTPIVTPRTNLPLVNLPASSRPVSRQTNLGSPLEEREEDEEEEEEEEEGEAKKREEYRNKRHEDGEEADNYEDLASTLSGLSLSSNSGWDVLPSAAAPPTPPAVKADCPPKEERKEVAFSGSCARGVLRATSRALTAVSTSYRTRHSKYCNCTSSHHTNEVTMVDAKVIYATSHDPKFPPAAAVDGRPDTFWASSGLYPQFLVVSLPGLTSIENVNLVAYNVRKVSIARSIKTQPTDFEEITQEELKHVEGKLQESPILSQHVSAIHLKITIEEGYNHFCSVHKVSVEGSVSSSYSGGTGGITQLNAGAIKSDPLTQMLSPQNNSVNATPTYHRPQSPVQVISKGYPQITRVERGDEEDEEDDEVIPFNNSSHLGRLDDDDEF